MTRAPEQARLRGKSWAEDAIANIELLRAKVAMRRSELCSGNHVEAARFQSAALDEVERLLACAESAAKGECPHYVRVLSWWSGACTEAAFRSIHNAEALLARAYGKAERRAVLPDTVRRIHGGISLDDPTSRRAKALLDAQEDAPGKEYDVTPEELSELIAIGHEVSDRHRMRLRIFRNLLIIGNIVTIAILVGVIAIASVKPHYVPLCFVQDSPPTPPTPWYACPTHEGNSPPPPGGPASGGDMIMIAVMGLLGGSLSAAVFIRGLYVNATPYNVSIPLAVSKLPAGALVAVMGLLLVKGDFIPGFSTIDRQSQILAYAAVLGFAQQLFTQLLDQRAERLLAGVPTKVRHTDTEPPIRG